MNPAMSCRAVKLLPRKRIFNSSANEGVTEKTARSAIVILRIIGGVSVDQSVGRTGGGLILTRSEEAIIALELSCF